MSNPTVKPNKSTAPFPFVSIDSDDGDTCYYTCPHCNKRSHSEYDKWCSIIVDDPTMPSTMICPKCGCNCSHPDDFQEED